MSQPESHYEVLGVPPQAGPDQIRSRYRELARKCHPDVAGSQSHTAFQRLTLAYNVLADPQQRAQYDRSLQPQPPVRQAKPPAAVLRSPAMQRLLSEAEGDALAEADQHVEALALYREALGRTPNPALEAKIARTEAKLTGAAPPPAPPRPTPTEAPDPQPFWRRWFGRDGAAGQS